MKLTDRNDNTIAIKTTRVNNGKSGSCNANPKIRNNGYVTMLLSLFDILNLQSNQGGYQREFKRIRVAVRGIKSSLKWLLFALVKAEEPFLKSR